MFLVKFLFRLEIYHSPQRGYGILDDGFLTESSQKLGLPLLTNINYSESRNPNLLLKDWTTLHY